MNLEEFIIPENINIWLQKYRKTQDCNIKIQLRNFIALTCIFLAKKVAYGMARRSTDPVEDLIQVGIVGLLKAIEQYDTNLGASFKTYANYLITGEIRHYIRDKGIMIRAPREWKELAFRINQLIKKLTSELGRVPTDLEIASELQIPVNRVTEIIDIDRRTQMLSLDQSASNFDSDEEEEILVDKLIDNKYQDFLIIRENRMMLEGAIKMLDDCKRRIIELSFFEDMSQSDIAKNLGISQMQVSRNLKSALEELFELITTQKTDIEYDYKFNNLK